MPCNARRCRGNLSGEFDFIKALDAGLRKNPDRGSVAVNGVVQAIALLDEHRDSHLVLGQSRLAPRNTRAIAHDSMYLLKGVVKRGRERPKAALVRYGFLRLGGYLRPLSFDSRLARFGLARFFSGGGQPSFGRFLASALSTANSQSPSIFTESGFGPRFSFSFPILHLY